MRIGVFDSGIGGLTVLKALINNYPNNDYIYYGDTLHLPYGTKTKEELLLYSENIIDFFTTKQVELIIIACGTVSSNLYDELKEKYEVPLLDVLNPTINYIAEKKLTNIGLLATPMTIQSKTFSKKLGRPIKAISCPLFVPLIESGQINSSDCETAVRDYISQLQDCENIILGCTHYPILKNIIKKYSAANLIDMGQCICDSLKINEGKSQTVNLYFSSVSNILIENVKMIMGKDYLVKLKKL